MINPKLGYSDKTQELIERQCRNVEGLDFELDKKKAEECLLKTYDIFNLPRPKNIKWCVDLQDTDFQNSALSAGSALSARSARSARSATDYDFDWFVFEYEYCQNPDKEPPNENDWKYLEYCELLMQAKEAGLGYRVEWKDTIYLVPIPIVRINSRNMFHSVTEPAIRWKDGQEIFCLNGVIFPKDLWEKAVNRKLSFKEISEISDIDQRTQAMAFCDVKDFEKLGTIVDSYEKQSLDGGKVTYKLLKIPQGLFTIDAYFAIYNCPSTNKLYLSGIDPEVGKKNDIALSMAWKMAVKKEDFINMIPLLNES